MPQSWSLYQGPHIVLNSSDLPEDIVQLYDVEKDDVNVIWFNELYDFAIIKAFNSIP